MSVSLPDAHSSTFHRPAVRLSRRNLRLLKRSESDSLVDLLEEAPQAKARAHKWKRVHRRTVVAVDALILAVVAMVAHIVAAPQVASSDGAAGMNPAQASVLSVVLAIGWLVALEAQRSRDISLIGIGAEEYRRVIFATFWVFGIFAVTAVLLDVSVPRAQVSVVLGLGLVALVIGRHCIRKRLARRRLRGEFITRVVVFGNPESARVLCRSFGRSTDTGYRVVGACIPDFVGEIGDELDTPSGRIPILGDGRTVTNAMDLTSADALAVAAGEHLGQTKMKKLLWQLESAGTDLIVMPGVTDVAGPRVQMRPIDNLPLFHIAPPRQDGPSAISKRLFDMVLSTAALICAAPILLLAACAIKLDDGGPIIFRQERVGHHGRPFRIFKLRTMSVNADARKELERHSANDSGVFFKSACDSRVTRVGRFLRATSIDELPQLLNVLGGSMSVVGPRPLVPGEGESVEDFVQRRGLVKPGITGLWQISGRSDLSEDERIRLDHSYVDNWSCVLDLLIVWRTARAVLRREGAY
ncbi:sugar transferase [Mycolicibacterium stellerae]|uniref:sugar transferase n=1 Tax=Mycolicibacterium stellerae TaxID=2358193 RepID=UPI000F0B88D4|nr:sugar transferase [Mycolicibacterium stellerae]